MQGVTDILPSNRAKHPTKQEGQFFQTKGVCSQNPNAGHKGGGQSLGKPGERADRGGALALEKPGTRLDRGRAQAPPGKNQEKIWDS